MVSVSPSAPATVDTTAARLSESRNQAEISSGSAVWFARACRNRALSTRRAPQHGLLARIVRRRRLDRISGAGRSRGGRRVGAHVGRDHRRARRGSVVGSSAARICATTGGGWIAASRVASSRVGIVGNGGVWGPRAAPDLGHCGGDDAIGRRRTLDRQDRGGRRSRARGSSSPWTTRQVCELDEVERGSRPGERIGTDSTSSVIRSVIRRSEAAASTVCRNNTVRSWSVSSAAGGSAIAPRLIA